MSFVVQPWTALTEHDKHITVINSLQCTVHNWTEPTNQVSGHHVKKTIHVSVPSTRNTPVGEHV